MHGDLLETACRDCGARARYRLTEVGCWVSAADAAVGKISAFAVRPNTAMDSS